MSESKKDVKIGAKGLYFSHDSDAHNDDKMIPMIAEYDFTGYGWYWRVLEQMRKLPGYKLKVGGKYGLKALCKMLNNAEPTIVERWLDDCCNEFELFQLKDGYISSESFVRRMTRVDETRESNKKAGIISAMKRAEKQANNKNNSTDVEQPLNQLKLKSKLKSKSNNDITIKDGEQDKKKLGFICEDSELRNHQFWNSIEFQKSWLAFVEMRKTKKWDLTERSTKTLLNELILLAGNNVERAIYLVDLAETNKWRFIYDRKTTGQINHQQNKGYVRNAYEDEAKNIS